MRLDDGRQYFDRVFKQTYLNPRLISERERERERERECVCVYAADCQYVKLYETPGIVANPDGIRLRNRGRRNDTSLHSLSLPPYLPLLPSLPPSLSLPSSLYLYQYQYLSTYICLSVPLSFSVFISPPPHPSPVAVKHCKWGWGSRFMGGKSHPHAFEWEK
jgi:hypothetical protein